VCYHPLFPFDDHGDCLAAKRRPGNVSSSDDWEELLLPKIDRQLAEGRRVAFRADAAFARPAIDEALATPSASRPTRIWSSRSKTSCFGRRDDPAASRSSATRASSIVTLAAARPADAGRLVVAGSGRCPSRPADGRQLSRCTAGAWRRKDAKLEKIQRNVVGGADAVPPKGRDHGAIAATENVDRSAGSLAYHADNQGWSNRKCQLDD
jgi:DDE family transposase